MKLYIFLANGFEDIEAVATIDICRRAGLEVTTVSTTGTLDVVTAHNIPLRAEVLFEDCDFSDASMLILPGGMSPGAAMLYEHEGLLALIMQHYKLGTPLAAICAAPFIFGRLGILEGKCATCYPGFESELAGATYTANKVEVDGQFITGKGPGATSEFAFAIVEHFCGKEKVEELKSQMQF